MEGITYFDFSDPFEPADFENDPFDTETVLDPGPAQDLAPPPEAPLKTPRRPDLPARPDLSPPRDAFEFALADLSPARSRPPAPARTPLRDTETAVPSNPPEADVAFATLASFVESPAPDPAAEQHAEFVAAFEAARAGGPFLALALRMTPGVPTAAWFPLVEEGFAAALPPEASTLVDRERLRIVAVLPGQGDAAARPLFARLMAYLEEHIADADLVGHDIAVFPAPGGRPFQSAEAFLATTFDGP